MICIRCGVNLIDSEEPIKCVHCKTINQPVKKPKFQHQFSPPRYAPLRDKYINEPVTPVQSNTGLGDVVANITSAMGIQSCGGCKRRQQLLNAVVPNIAKPWVR